MAPDRDRRSVGGQGDVDLFGDPIVPEDVPQPVQEEPRLSAGARATARRRAQAAAGVNPLTGVATPIHLVGATCGGCLHRVTTTWHRKSYPKCDAHSDRASHSEASDVRAYWPACSRWEAQP